MNIFIAYEDCALIEYIVYENYIVQVNGRLLPKNQTEVKDGDGKVILQVTQTLLRKEVSIPDVLRVSLAANIVSMAVSVTRQFARGQFTQKFDFFF